MIPARSDAELVTALLAGDSGAFSDVVAAMAPTMARVARTIVRSEALVDEVVQEAWLAILHALPRFEGRSSLRTWMLRILVNRARTRAVREARSVPFSALGNEDDDDVVSPDRFDAHGHWRAPIASWSADPEALASDRQVVSLVEAAIEHLPERQRLVLVLRDVEGWSSDEVRNALELSETNQRVLLHRARAKVRAAIEPHLGGAREDLS
jgi:RNA polymerase sigma-70 factor, ECF subfamily